jgi:hypothetical protein
VLVAHLFRGSLTVQTIYGDKPTYFVIAELAKIKESGKEIYETKNAIPKLAISSNIAINANFLSTLRSNWTSPYLLDQLYLFRILQLYQFIETKWHLLLHRNRLTLRLPTCVNYFRRSNDRKSSEARQSERPQNIRGSEFPTKVQCW